MPSKKVQRVRVRLRASHLMRSRLRARGRINPRKNIRRARKSISERMASRCSIRPRQNMLRRRMRRISKQHLKEKISMINLIDKNTTMRNTTKRKKRA